VSRAEPDRVEPDAVPPRRGGPQAIPRPPHGVEPGQPAPWAHLPEDLLHPRVEAVREALAGLGPARPSPVERLGFTGAALPTEIQAIVGTREPRPAAVLAPLYERDGEAWVLLTRRSRELRAHAGEVSFPGGRAEEGDRDLVHTALRETEEEIGLAPSQVEVIGELDHLATFTSGSFIIPWVGIVDRPHEARSTSPEVDAVLHVPLSELLAPGVFREESWSFGGTRRPIVFFELFGDTVWGATAAMLRQLLGIVTGTLGRGDLDHD
jgi:8-oxo-dGTP pyrophosphatase MutT (NUDIX family)